jgi:hypothetical protein
LTRGSNSTLSYVYDFGDYWDHRITIEKTHPADPLMTLLFCIAGAGATPPEDCGGVPGYADFVRAMADPSDPEHSHLVKVNEARARLRTQADRTFTETQDRWIGIQAKPLIDRDIRADCRAPGGR